MCIYRNVRILDGQANTTKWPLVDVPIDQKTDPEWCVDKSVCVCAWCLLERERERERERDEKRERNICRANANISFVHDYIWCNSPAKKGFHIIDLSRLLVAW